MLQIGTLKPGQVWRDNYKPATQADTRYVKVLEVPATVEAKTDISIQRCTEEGAEIAHSPKRTTKAERFNGGKAGFTLHKDADGTIVAPQAAAQAQGNQPQA